MAANAKQPRRGRIAEMRVAALGAIVFLLGVACGVVAGRRSVYPWPEAPYIPFDFFTLTSAALSAYSPAQDIRVNITRFAPGRDGMRAPWAVWWPSQDGRNLYSHPSLEGWVAIPSVPGCASVAVLVPDPLLFRESEERLAYWVNQLSEHRGASVWRANSEQDVPRVLSDTIRSRPDADRSCSVLVLLGRGLTDLDYSLVVFDLKGVKLAEEKFTVPYSHLRWVGIPVIVVAFLVDCICIPLWAAWWSLVALMRHVV